jgi:hypothetical protein
MYLRRDIISAVESLIEAGVNNPDSHNGWLAIIYPILDKFGPDFEVEAKEAAEELLRRHCPDFDSWVHDFERLCNDFKHSSFNHAGKAFKQAQGVGWKPRRNTGEEQLELYYEIQDKATRGEPELSPYWLSKGFETPSEAFTYKGATYLPRYDEEGDINSYWKVYKDKNGSFPKSNAAGLPATGFFSSIEPVYSCLIKRIEGDIPLYAVENGSFLTTYFQEPARYYPADEYEKESHLPGFITEVLVIAESVPKYQAYEAALRHEGNGDLIDSKTVAFLCSFSCVNIPRHAAWVRKVRPDMLIKIIIDRSKDGKLSGEGWRKAVEACRQNPQIHVVDPGDGYSDLDDLFRAKGPEAVSQCIAAARPLTREEMDSVPRVDVVPMATSSKPAEGEAQNWVEELNGKYYPVQVGAKMTVAFMAESALGYPEVRLVTFHTFRDMHCSQYVVTGYDKGKPIIKPKSDWLTHPARNPNRELIFDPGAPPWADREGRLNLWFGFRKFGDAEQGSPNVMLDHIREVICSNDPEKYEYLLKWLAYCIQFPERRPEVAVVLMGLKGCGKGTLGQLLVYIFDGHGIHVVNREHITGRFNGHLASAAFVFADEAFFHNDHKSEAVLKALVTEPTQLLERKGIDALPMPNRISLMMASNDDHVVNAGAIERRYFVTEVSPSKIGDRTYFDRIAKWRDNGDNIESFIQYLQSIDIEDFNPRVVPTTRELSRQKALSLPALEQWLVESLTLGSFMDTQDDWINIATIDALGRSYDDWCDRMKKGSYDRLSRDNLAKKLCKMLPMNRRKIRLNEYALMVVEDNLKIKPLDGISRKVGRIWVYELGTLGEMRSALIAALQLDSDTFEGA